METEDVISIPADNDSDSVGEEGELRECDTEASDADCLRSNVEGGEELRDGEDFIELNKGDNGSEEGEIVSEGGSSGEKGVDGMESSCLDSNQLGTGEGVPETLMRNGEIGIDSGKIEENAEVDMDLVDSPEQQRIEVVDNVAVVETSLVHAENCSITGNNRRDDNRISGVKRARSVYEKDQASVHVSYKSLTRASKRKLEELLQQWSEWHAKHDTSSQVEEEVLESGEDTYFPALYIGTKKSSSVSFWIENQINKHQTDEFISLDHNSVPLYDRGFSLGLASTDGSNSVESGLKVVNEGNRCFNCGSYDHSLRDCPKPRDNVAVNNARKQHKAKRNQNASSRGSSRYFLPTSGGKYDDLKPGTLHPETRRLLGLGELDPPPWLHNMRQLGYPPGYLETDNDSQPSGITIFSDEEVTGQEDGEIIGEDDAKPKKKMTVEFPGINAPIPENADPWLWAVKPSPNRDSSASRAHHRSNHYEQTSRWNHMHHERRSSRDSTYEGPPGVDSICSPSFSSYPPRYSMQDFIHSDSRTDSRSRSSSDRGKRSALVYEDFVTNTPYSNKHPSPRDHGSSRYEYDSDRWSGRSHGYDYDHHSRHSRR